MSLQSRSAGLVAAPGPAPRAATGETEPTPEPPSYTDRIVSDAISDSLREMRLHGRDRVRILDLCRSADGWLQRTVRQARATGFSRVEALGHDPHRRSAEDARSADLCLCLSPAGPLDRLVAEAGRVTVGTLILLVPAQCAAGVDAAGLRALASRHLDVVDLVGLDLFHERLASDPRWLRGGARPPFDIELDSLEQRFCRDWDYIDRATNLLLVAEAR